MTGKGEIEIVTGRDTRDSGYGVSLTRPAAMIPALRALRRRRLLS